MKENFVRIFGWFSILSILVAIMPSPLAQSMDDLRVLPRWIEWSDATNSLQHHLNAMAFELLGKRRAQIGKLKTADDWRTRQAEVRSILNRIVGPFPDRTPLRPRVTGTVQREGFRIEKIILASQPEFYVTGCLFIPDNLRE